MKFMILGSQGMLGSSFAEKIKTTAPFWAYTPDSAEVDITKYDSLKTYLLRNFAYPPFAVVNCAAYTDVRGAELNRQWCYDVNTFGVHNLIRFCNKYKIKLIHFSTDYVFDDHGAKNPYNWYGWTKLFAEQAIEKTCKNYQIIRTAGLYSTNTNYKSFPSNMLKIKKPIQVIQNNYSQWTLVDNLSSFLVDRMLHGGKDFAPIVNITDEGSASPYSFLKTLYEADPSIGDFEKEIIPCRGMDVDLGVKRLTDTPFRFCNDDECFTTGRNWQDAVKYFALNRTKRDV